MGRNGLVVRLSPMKYFWIATPVRLMLLFFFYFLPTFLSTNGSQQHSRSPIRRRNSTSKRDCGIHVTKAKWKCSRQKNKIIVTTHMVAVDVYDHWVRFLWWWTFVFSLFSFQPQTKYSSVAIEPNHDEVDGRRDDGEQTKFVMNDLSFFFFFLPF